MKEKANPVISEYELDEIRTFIEHRSGILFDASRERFFSSHILEHMSAKHLAHGIDLIRKIRASNIEYDHLLERLLTQETSFFRYPAIYDALHKRVLPELHMKKFWENPRTLRIWSAGCATGEEPYSLAITIADALMFAEAWNIEILATDISKKALKQAERGVYSRRSLGHLSPRQLETHFLPHGVAGHEFVVKPRIRRMVSFATMNLAQAVYLGRLDFIFCMNVMIYFSEARRNSLIQHFYEYLEPGGYLLLGHSESVSNVPVKFESVVHGDCILYRKPAGEMIYRGAALMEGAL
ncbi:MAG TPA: protein-glutamate O-methyltransferase CheR [Candidatus Acidoferrales bacterium]|nr:protein-glutamate O-methyltransferase CheR [Candidatus Acidoferrales bacterium]